MKYKELYKRPCYAECAECGGHGTIVLCDGTHTEMVMSMEGGKKVINRLLEEGKINQDQADHIEDTMLCADRLANKDDEVIDIVKAKICKGVGIAPEEFDRLIATAALLIATPCDNPDCPCGKGIVVNLGKAPPGGHSSPEDSGEGSESQSSGA